MTLAATTVSIVLTFGTTAIVERRKQKAQKREMVLMLMYDMRESLKVIEQCDQDLNAFFDIQVDAIAHPEEFDKKYLELAVHLPTIEYTTTTETIFRSSMETIRTIGNLLFVETVSSFYDQRENYKHLVVEGFLNQMSDTTLNYKFLRDFDSAAFPFYSWSIFRQMESDYEKCKLMMKVKDDDLEVFSRQQQKLEEMTRRDIAEESAKASAEWQERNVKLQKAREAGRQ